MKVDASVFFDLTMVAMHNNEVSTMGIYSEILRIKEENITIISSSELVYINFYEAILREIIGSRLILEKNEASIRAIVYKYLSCKQLKDDKGFNAQIKSALGEKMTVERLVSLTKRVNNFIMWHAANKATRRIFGKLQECAIAYDPADQESKIADTSALLSDFQRKLIELSSTIGDSQAIEKIDMTNKEQITKAIITYNERKVTHVIHTGLQGLNRMCGKRKGFALGESVMFCALSHNYKSSMLMAIALWIVAYSTPPISSKKPMILFVSLENEAFENMMQWFHKLYYMLHGKLPENMSDEDIATCIQEYFSSKGYTLVIERYLPAVFGFDELVSLIERYTSSGFKIHAVMIDYLSQMKSPTTNSNVANHQAVKILFNSVCNYTKACGITMFSGHQLNRKAAELASIVPNPVKSFGDEHIGLSIAAIQEPDLIIYLHIKRNDNGVPFLTMQRGKHRYVSDTPEAHKYVAYELTDFGLVDDIDSEYNGVADIYANGKEHASLDDDSDLVL